MNAVRYIGWLAALVAAGAVHAADAPAIRDIQWRWEDVPRVVAFGDVHGAYDELVSLLRAAGIVDDQLRWTGGKSHVVSVGDLIDRGSATRAVLDLVMRLQEEADAAGGRFHVVIGNHEVMNMTADFRYVTDEDFAEFADDEPAGTRDRALEHFVDAHGGLSDTDARTEFLDSFPPGYFGRRAAFAPTGRYGRWLLGLPALIVIDDTAFVHGGLPPVVSKLGGAALNRELRRDLRDFLDRWIDLAEADVVASGTDALSAADEVAALLEDSSATLDSDTIATAKEFVALSHSAALSEDGLLWYRGTAWCHPLLESAVLEAALARLGAERVAVGHSPSSNRRIVSRMEDRVILLDTGMLEPYFHGRAAALVIEDDSLAAIYPDEPSRTSLSREQPNVAAPFRDVDELERSLSTAALTDSGEANLENRHYRLLTLSVNGEDLPARFTTARGYEHEVAAYRLARALGLGIVPPAALRKVAGKTGALTVWSETLVNEAERVETGSERPNRCAAGNDYQLMYIFDALVHNRGRATADIRYTADQKSLWLADHLETFGTESRIPDYLRNAEVMIPPVLFDRLAALDEARLQELLGKLLSRREIKAILKRRDGILDLWPQYAPADGEVEATRSALAVKPQRFAPATRSIKGAAR